MKLYFSHSILAAVLLAGASAADGGLRSETIKERELSTEAPTEGDEPQIAYAKRYAQADICEFMPGTTKLVKKHIRVEDYDYREMFKNDPTAYFYSEHTYPDAESPNAKLGGKTKFELTADCKIKGPVVTGDPHFTQFGGNKFAFQGGCDLVLLHNPNFNNGQGMTIHVRTRIQRWWSFIQSVVVQIGDDKFEVKAGFEEKKFWFNGEEGDKKLVRDSGPMPFTLGGNKIRFRVRKQNEFQFKIFLEDDQVILIRSVEDLLRVEIDKPLDKSFAGSTGLMGNYDEQDMVARDGSTLLRDPDTYGKEWQVLNTEPMLFHNIEGVQHPQTCAMPSTTPTEEARRRLGHGKVSRDLAEEACASAHKDEFDDCVEDVLAMDDMEIAGAY